MRLLRVIAWGVYLLLMFPGILAAAYWSPGWGLGLIGAANAWWFGLTLGIAMRGERL